jgi:hypothetical protein
MVRSVTVYMLGGLYRRDVDTKFHEKPFVGLKDIKGRQTDGNRGDDNITLYFLIK